MRVTWQNLGIPGLALSSGASVSDARGSFTKVLSGADPVIEDFGAREIYYTRSARGVLRGMHFQLPPEATSKLVFVISGEIRDFVLDLRTGSPTDRELVEVTLTPTDGALLVPKGCAHAYEAMEDDTVVCYAQDVPFGSPEFYGGIRPDSAGIVPHSPTPVMLERDLELPALDDFTSPFIFE